MSAPLARRTASGCQRPAHWPSLFPATVFGAPATGGVLFLKHSRFPPIVLAATSGVPKLPELPLKSTLPLTVLDITKGARAELLLCTIRLPWTTPPEARQRLALSLHTKLPPIVTLGPT